MSGDYEKYQKEIQLLAKDLFDIASGGTLNIENNILKISQQIIYFNLIIATVLFVVTVIVLLMMYFLFAGREKAIIKKEKELKVREKMEQKYRVLFENATEAIFIADSQTRQLVDCNLAAEKLLGYSRAELLAMKANELHPKDKEEEIMKKFQKQAEGKLKSIFTEVLTKNKKRIPVKINASPVNIGGKIYSQGMFAEIT
jgi:PAS domain S-box-containing protein